jgi:predicted Zn finger-like uncharacterized protein
MRIVCQKCAAAYAIDDRVITPKGVRAQCPRCRHLQLVKREETPAQPGTPKPAASKPVAAAKPSTPASMTPSRPLTSDDLFGDLGDLESAQEPQDAPSDALLSDLSSVGKSPAASSPAKSNDSLFGDLADLTRSSPSTPAPSSQPRPATPALPEPLDDGLFDFNAPPGFSAPAPKPAAPAPKPAAPAPKPAAPVQSKAAAPAFPEPEPSDDALFDFNAPPGFSSPPPASSPAAPAPLDAAADPFLDFIGAPPPQPQPIPEPVGTPAPAQVPDATPQACRECGKQLVDPFDEALGSCEDCRQRAKQPAPEARSVEVIDDLPPPESSGGGRPAMDTPALATEPRSTVRPASQRPPARSGVSVSASRGRGRGALMGGVVLLLLVGGGGASYMFVPEVRALLGSQEGGAVSGPSKQNQPVAAASSSSSSTSLPPAVESVLPRWKLLFADASGGDSKQLVTQGQSLLAQDQRLAYSQAAESFQRALLADPRNDEAIGGYVQALALGYGSRLDESTFKEASDLIQAATKRAGGRSDLLVAHANLLLTRPGQSGNVEQVRKLAEAALADSREGAQAQKVEAHLVLGRTYLSTSRELAQQHFESALAISPDLRRAQYYRALADESSGDYPRAIERLRKLLEQDPGHWESRTTLARIFLEVGEVERARQLYEARLKSTPGDFHALLSLAVLRYQVEGGVTGGLGALRGLLRNREKYEEREVAELLLHLAAAERSANNLDAAAKAARESLSLAKRSPEASLQLFLITLARKDASAAAEHLASLRGHLEDPMLEKVLEGRLKLLERKPAEAMELFMEVARLDPRRVDALLLAGVAAAQDGRRDEAIRVFAQVLQADPLRLAPRPLVTSFYLRPGDLLAGLEGSIVAIARGGEDLLPHLYEGLLRFHQGDTAAAEKMLKKVTEVDASNAPAFAYRTFIALGRKDLKAAKAHAAQAVASGRREAIAHLAQGLVLVESKQAEPARRALREAVMLSPKQYAAEVKLAELEASTSADAVRAKMVRLLGLDPSYLPAKRILYMLDKRG